MTRPEQQSGGEWVAELALSANGMHEIRAGAVNARERPLVGYAATCEIARVIAAAPALLAAAIAARDLIEIVAGIKSSDEPEAGSVGQKLRDAIAKATRP